jgi:alginate O-acetyltransferase complex protein AlgJ
MYRTRLTSGTTVSRRSLIAAFAAALSVSPFGPTRAATIYNGTVVGKAGWLYLVWDDPRRIDPRLLQRVTQNIGRTVDALKSGGIDTVIALVPAKARLYSEFTPDDFKFSSESEPRYAIALEALRASGALVPDLATFFTALRKSEPTKQLYFKGDTHWTAFAAERAAVEIARQMKEKLHLPASAHPGTRFGGGATVLTAKGDLSEMLPKAMQKDFPAESYQIPEVVVPKARNALIEDDDADVAVVGNSFMQPKLDFAATLSNQLDRPVSLTWKVHTVGPYRVMLDYLGSESFKRRRPKVIVWNFHELDMMILPDSDGAFPEDAMTSDAFLTQVRRMAKV